MLESMVTEAGLFACAEQRRTGMNTCPECLGWAHRELKRETQRESRRPGETRGVIRPVSEPARVAPRPLPRVFPPGGARKVPVCTTRSGHACADTPLGQTDRVSQRRHRLDTQWYVPNVLLPERQELPRLVLRRRSSTRNKVAHLSTVSQVRTTY